MEKTQYADATQILNKLNELEKGYKILITAFENKRSIRIETSNANFFVDPTSPFPRIASAVQAAYMLLDVSIKETISDLEKELKQI